MKTRSKEAQEYINVLMGLSANGDSSASNVLDMIDGNEYGARTATAEQLQMWYKSGKDVE
jgi:hypothetical protein